MEVSKPKVTDRDVLEANRHAVKVKKKYNKYVSKFLKKMMEHVSFEINLKSPEKKEAFRQAIRVFHRKCEETMKPVMIGEEENGHKEYNTIGKMSLSNINIDIEKILDVLDDHYKW